MGLLIFLFLTALSSFFYWVAKLRMKRRLRERLGREVADRELTSIASWMEAIPDSKPTGKESQR
jgi:hypothetical protein